MPLLTVISLATGIFLHMGSRSSSGRISSCPILASWLIPSASTSSSTPRFLFLARMSPRRIMAYLSSRLAGHEMKQLTRKQSCSHGYIPWYMLDSRSNFSDLQR